MGLTRKYKIVFTRETLTDEGVVVKEKAPIIGQICETEHMFENVLVPEVVIEETILQKLFEGLKVELHNPNHCLNTKNITNEVKVEEPPIEQTITPLNSQFANKK